MDGADILPPVTFSVEGEPQGKGRPRFFRRGAHVGTFTPEKTRTYEGLVRSAALDAMAGRLPQDGPVCLTLTAFFSIPKSFSKAKRTDATLGALKPTKRPDLDNIAKAFKDGMNGVVYHDDAQIVRAELQKRYGTQALVVVTVKPA